MFTFLRNLFVKKAPVPFVPKETAADRFAKLSELAPLRPAVAAQNLATMAESAPPAKAASVSESASAALKQSIICREAVLDRSQRIAGYEFTLHDRLHSRFSDQREATRKIYDDLLVRSLSAFDISSLLGHRLAIAELAPASLGLVKLQSLPADNTVLMIDPPMAYQPDVAALREQLLSLKMVGFRLGWKLRPNDTVWREVLPYCDYLRIQTPAFDGLQMAGLVADARKIGAESNHGLKIIGAEIETVDDFQLCFQAGFDFFHGLFISSRQNWLPPKSEIDRVRVIRLLNQLRSGAENEALAEGLTQDPVLTFKMLRYVNSAAMGLHKEITSMPQALMMLGREKFYRWLSLLLFDVMNASYTERNLIEQALVRARMMEQLALALDQPELNADQLFLTGLFSLLPLMLGQSVEQVLAQIVVPENVSLALSAHTGPIAPYLDLVMACESGVGADMEALAAACGLDVQVINRELLLALSWAQELQS